MRCPIFAAVCLCLPCLAAAKPGDDFATTAAPLLERFCYDCHGDGADEGGLAFDAFASTEALLAERELWAKIDLHLRSHTMPPQAKPAPTLTQRQTLRRWIDDAVFWVDPTRPDPGPPVMRRLTRAEYNNSVRDLFHVTSRPADQFPPDDAAHGFDTAGATFRLSPMLLEKYLRAARQVAEDATRLRPVEQAGELARDNRILTFAGTPQRRDQLVLLDAEDHEVGFQASLPAKALYRVKLRAAATVGPDGEGARCVIFDNGRRLTELVTPHEFKGKRQYWESASALVELDAGEHRFSLKSAAAGRTLAVHTFAVQGPFAPVEPQRSEFLSSLVSADRALALPVLQLSGEDLDRGEGKSSLDTGKSWFSTAGYRFARIVLPEAGNYRFRVKAGAQQAGDEPVRLGLRLGERDLGEIPVTAHAQQAKWLELTAHAPAGEHELQVWFRNELLDAAGKGLRWLWVHELQVIGPLEAETGLRADEVPEMLGKIGRRVFRRPLSEEESRRLAALTQNAASPMEALRSGIEALLASPKFLTLGGDFRPVGEAANGTAPIDEFSLASRLAYFLWSSVPDERLLDLAENGALRANFAAEVTRLLDDPKSRGLTENFAGQWLQLRDLERHRPAPDTFPNFSDDLLAAMRQETERFFEAILRENRSVLEFLTAGSSAHVSPELAGHYGSAPRRGLLGHGSILTLTSHPTRTSPVNRGRFVLDKLLGLPPPPAPDRVPPLEDSKSPNSGQTLREQLEAHRADKSCAGCHAFLDPMGLALENFDATGRWRDTDRGQPIDPGGQLVTGEKFANFGELQALLPQRHGDDFVRNLAEQLLVYALGRGLEFTDKLAVREVIRRTEADDFRFRALILAVCESVPFQRISSADFQDSQLSR